MPKLRTDGITSQQLGEEIVLLDLEGSVYFRLNGSGAVLWQRLVAGEDRGQLVMTLMERYDLEADVAERDVDEFLHQLDAVNLLEDE